MPSRLLFDSVDHRGMGESVRGRAPPPGYVLNRKEIGISIGTQTFEKWLRRMGKWESEGFTEANQEKVENEKKGGSKKAFWGARYGTVHGTPHHLGRS